MTTVYYQPYWLANGELEHHGILGMKWGVRRYQNKDGSLTAAGKKRYDGPTREEKRETKQLKRQVAAAEKNLVEKGRTYAQSRYDIHDAEKNYEKVNKKMYLFKKNRLNAIKEASEQLTNALEIAERPMAERSRAVEIYNNAAKQLLDNNKKMIKKYGSEKVKEIGTKNVQYGERLAKSGWFSDQYEILSDTVLKTGLTVVNIPWYGQRYTGKYVSEKELDIRNREFVNKAKKQY